MARKYEVKEAFVIFVDLIIFEIFIKLNIFKLNFY